MKVIPSRPNHTGTARIEARKETTRKQYTRAQPTHQFTKGAAVALEAPERDTRPDMAYRRARHPLALSNSREALALRQAVDGPIEVLICSASGEHRWLPVSKILDPLVLRAWVREGFAG